VPTCLLTGGAGFVGRHMLPALLAAGYDVHTVDVAHRQTSRRAREDARWFETRADVRDWFRVATSEAPYDLVVHLAAVVGGRATIEGAPLSVAVDLAIDAELFGWAIRTRPGRVLYYSSSAAYPTRWQTDSGIDLHEGLIDLDRIRTPDLTYGWAKLTGEMLARHARAAGVPVTVVRPFSGYGPDQDLDYPFPSFIRRALDWADPFEVWGDGRQVRDFVHIDDVVELSLAMVERGLDGPLNIGTGVPTTFLDLARIVCDVAGYEPEIRALSDKPVGVRRRVADTTQLTRALWAPRTDLATGVAQALGV
jgi:nucleoside-diphosphate-sugar epimerase